MNAKANYFKIGLFVIIAVALIVVAVVIFGSGLFTKEKVYFETYFDSAVTGLSVGAHVLHRGVRIGQVEKITFLSNEYELPKDKSGLSEFESYVMVVASADEENLTAKTQEQRKTRLNALIERGLRLRLATNLLTGQGYLEGSYLDPQRFPALKIDWEPKRLYIPSAPGEFSTIKNSFDSILYKLEKIDTEKIGLAIEDVLTSLNEAIKDANIPQISARLTDVLKRTDELIASQRPEIEQSLENLREVSDNLKDLTETLKRHPSNLIFSKPPPKSEVIK